MGTPVLVGAQPPPLFPLPAGKSPLVVFDDANIDAALEWTLFGGFYNCGQICSATARVLVRDKEGSLWHSSETPA